MQETLHGILVILGACAGLAVMVLVIRRWFAPIRRGIVGLVMIFFPLAFDALNLSDDSILSGTSDLFLGIYLIFAVIGVFVLLADVTGKFQK